MAQKEACSNLNSNLGFRSFDCLRCDQQLGHGCQKWNARGLYCLCCCANGPLVLAELKYDDCYCKLQTSVQQQMPPQELVRSFHLHSGRLICHQSSSTVGLFHWECGQKACDFNLSRNLTVASCSCYLIGSAPKTSAGCDHWVRRCLPDSLCAPGKQVAATLRNLAVHFELRLKDGSADSERSLSHFDCLEFVPLFDLTRLEMWPSLCKEITGRG